MICLEGIPVGAGLERGVRHLEACAADLPRPGVDLDTDGVLRAGQGSTSLRWGSRCRWLAVNLPTIPSTRCLSIFQRMAEASSRITLMRGLGFVSAGVSPLLIRAKRLAKHDHCRETGKPAHYRA